MRFTHLKYRPIRKLSMLGRKVEAWVLPPPKRHYEEEEDACPYCGHKGLVHHNGQTVCPNCGSVIEERPISFEEEAKTSLLYYDALDSIIYTVISASANVSNEKSDEVKRYFKATFRKVIRDVVNVCGLAEAFVVALVVALLKSNVPVDEALLFNIVNYMNKTRLLNYILGSSVTIKSDLEHVKKCVVEYVAKEGDGLELLYL